MYILSTCMEATMNDIKQAILEHGTATTRSQALERLYTILTMLRSPEGCPWDRKQTPEKFKKNIIEEAYEYIDALHKNDLAGCEEELGDLYLVLTMLAIMHEESDQFELTDVLNTVSEKMIRRHPHVFTDSVEAEDSSQVLTLWDAIKKDVEGKKTTEENPYEHIPASLPPMERSEEIQKIARKKGFDWPDYNGAMEKIHEELDEFSAAVKQQDTNAIEEELGDLLFSIINVSRLCKVTPHIALHKTNEKFIHRYNEMVKIYHQEHASSFEDASFEDMDIYWEKAKAKIRE